MPIPLGDCQLPPTILASEPDTRPVRAETDGADNHLANLGLSPQPLAHNWPASGPGGDYQDRSCLARDLPHDGGHEVMRRKAIGNATKAVSLLPHGDHGLQDECS